LFYVSHVKPLIFQSNLYPTVGLQTPGEVVDANFGQLPFLYNIEEEIKVRLFADIPCIIMMKFKQGALITSKSAL
jgi:hypothetical protein